jgi:DNA-binding Lrp family transcriptional regulator
VDRIDRRLLDLLQLHLPLTEHPYQDLGNSLGLSEEEVLHRLRRLREEGILRQIGAIFDSSRLGYQSTLVAFEIDPPLLDLMAYRLNAHPGISHNYARDHRYNLWFTLTVPRAMDLRGETARLASEVGAKDFLFLPAIAIFKIGVRLSLSREEEEEGAFSLGGPTSENRQAGESIQPLTSAEIRAVRALQDDLPLQPRPFQLLAEREEMEEGELLEFARSFLSRGIMRRFSGILYHRQAGFHFNRLALWQVAEEEVREAGRKMAAVQSVSHCYQRATYPHWPYPLYTMFHAQTRREADEILQSLVEATGIREYLLLETIREYKKERVQYFQEEIHGA